MAERPIFAGFRACREVAEFGIMFRWLNQRNESGDCGMRMPSPDSDRNRRCAESLAIPKRVLSLYNGAQKNTLRGVRLHAPGLVRPALSLGTRSCLRRAAYLSGSGGASRGLPRLRQGETRTAGLSGRQSDLHPALCPTHVGRRCRSTTVKDIAQELRLHWETVKELRPRRIAAENCVSSQLYLSVVVASMRPRRIAAENRPVANRHGRPLGRTFCERSSGQGFTGWPKIRHYVTLRQ